MICERCRKRLATLKYTEVVDGKAYARNICDMCLRDLQDDASSGFEIGGDAPSPKHTAAAPVASPVTDLATTSDAVCSVCGTRLSEAVQSRRVGSAACYAEFREALEPVLRSRHPALIHRGKAPGQHSGPEGVLRQLQTKRALLRSALKMENYEEAAALRDEIGSLEAALKPGQN